MQKSRMSKWNLVSCRCRMQWIFNRSCFPSFKDGKADSIVIDPHKGLVSSLRHRRRPLIRDRKNCLTVCDTRLARDHGMQKLMPCDNICIAGDYSAGINSPFSNPYGCGFPWGYLGINTIRAANEEKHFSNQVASMHNWIKGDGTWAPQPTLSVFDSGTGHDPSTNAPIAPAKPIHWQAWQAGRITPGPQPRWKAYSGMRMRYYRFDPHLESRSSDSTAWSFRQTRLHQ